MSNILDMQTIIGVLGGILTLIAFGPYILSIIFGRTKPKRATWWIWTLNSLLLLVSYRAEGAQETIWLAVAYAIGCIIVALFSIKYGIGGWSKIDRFCFVGTFVAIILWIIIGSLATFITSLIIDLFGVAPTIYESLHHPEKEDKLSWIMWFVGGLLSLLVVVVWHQWSFETLVVMIYPAQIAITTGVIILFLFRSHMKI